MKVHEIMTAHARCVGLENTLVEAAGLMKELDVGALPVCENERLSGIVTDRDIVLRGTANGRDPNSTPVRDVMSQGVVSVSADDPVEEAVRIMEERQIRRLPVVARDHRLVGIVSLGDIAISSNPAFSGMALRDVSEPREPTARQQRLSRQSAPSVLREQTDERRRPTAGGKKRQAASRTRASSKTKTARKGKQRSPARKTSMRSRSRKPAGRSAG